MCRLGLYVVFSRESKRRNFDNSNLKNEKKKKGCCGGQNLGWEPEKLHGMHVNHYGNLGL